MKASVMIMTYNHEKCIAKALDSVLMQRTNFEYEIIVGEDCSTDDTRNILLGYKQLFPDKFRLLLNEQNTGGFENGRQALEACKGEYIASLDGDDYWTSPDKLQKQVDFLDNHSECAICFHDAQIVYEDGSKEPTSYRPSQKEFSTVEDLLLDNFIPTSAVMFRRGLFGEIPDWISALKLGDWPLHILNAHHGTIGYIDETMSVYVVHRNGVWSMKDRQFRELALIGLFEAFGTHLDTKYARIINRVLRWKYIWVSENYESLGNISGARTYAIKSISKHLSIISNPYRNRIDPNLASSMPGYIKSMKSADFFKSILRLYVVPVLKTYGITILKPHVPKLYRFLRARAMGILGI